LTRLLGLPSTSQHCLLSFGVSGYSYTFRQRFPSTSRSHPAHACRLASDLDMPKGTLVLLVGDYAMDFPTLICASPRIFEVSDNRMQWYNVHNTAVGTKLLTCISSLLLLSLCYIVHSAKFRSKLALDSKKPPKCRPNTSSTTPHIWSTLPSTLSRSRIPL
jgi:hypothetical protein